MNNKHDFAVRVATRTGKMTQEPLYPKGHPKRIEQDSERNNVDAPSPSKRKKKKNDRTLHASSEPVVDTPENPNDISICDAETQSGDEHEPSDNVNDNIFWRCVSGFAMMSMFMLMLNLANTMM